MSDGVPPRLSYWAMDALYAGLTVALGPYAVFRVLTQQKTRARWRAYMRDISERFAPRRPRTSDAPCVWVHGVSVGEVKAVARLVEAMKAEVEGLEILLTISTDTARRVAIERYPGHRIEFYPPDFSPVVADALDALRPDLILLVESEFWPNFLTAARARGVPVVLVNGRMSARSEHRFGLIHALSERVLGALTTVCVQLDTYAERFASVGVPRERIHVTGNMKLDNIPIQVADPRREAFRRLLGTYDRPLIVAGSTHPTEERALARMAREGLNARLLVAPRHPARAEAVEADIRREGMDVVRRSHLGEGRAPPPDAVILLDTVGELEIAYALADAVFVGGTLVRHGGQNVMEPASLGCPVVIGPSFQNFRGEVEMLLHAGGLVVAPDAEGVAQTLRAWLLDPPSAKAIGEKAHAAILASKGATQKTMAILAPILRDLSRSGGRRERGGLPERS